MNAHVYFLCHGECATVGGEVPRRRHSGDQLRDADIGHWWSPRNLFRRKTRTAWSNHVEFGSSSNNPRPLSRRPSLKQVGSLDSEQGFDEQVKGSVLLPGAYFGDSSALCRMLEPQTIVARERCLLIQVTSSHFVHEWCKTATLRSHFVLRLLGEHARLEHVLENEAALALFEEFTQSEFAIESLDFFKTASNFHHFMEHPAATLGAAEREAQRIYQTFLADAAEQQVNMPCQVRLRVRNVLCGCVGTDSETQGREEVLKMLFEEARCEAFTLLEKGPFSRFRRSPAFLVFLRQLNVSDPPPVSSAEEAERIRVVPVGCYARPRYKVSNTRTAPGGKNPHVKPDPKQEIRASRSSSQIFLRAMSR